LVANAANTNIQLKSKGKHTPFEGYELVGRVRATVVGVVGLKGFFAPLLNSPEAKEVGIDGSVRFYLAGRVPGAAQRMGGRRLQ
jgi:hypothetical protein